MKKLSIFAMGLATLASSNAFADSSDFSLPRAGDQGTYYFANVDATAFSALRESGYSEFYLENIGGSSTLLQNSLNSEQFTAAPRITIGKTTAEGWGIQSTYWDFQNSRERGFPGLTSATPTFGLGITSESARTRAYTLDVEVTKRLSASRYALTGSFGARYGRLENSDSASAQGLSNDLDLYLLNAQTRSGFHGAGITYSLSGIRPINNSWSLFASGRLSNLFGDNQASAQTSAFGSGPAGFAPAATSASSTEQDHLFIAEARTGLMWQRCMTNCPGRLFARIAFEYQYWNSGDLPTDAQADSGFTNSLADTFAEVSPFETQFVGLSLGTGIAW